MADKSDPRKEFLDAISALNNNPFLKQIRDASGDISFSAPGQEIQDKKDSEADKPKVSVQSNKENVATGIFEQMLPQLVGNFVLSQMGQTPQKAPPKDPAVDKSFKETGLNPIDLLSQMLLGQAVGQGIPNSPNAQAWNFISQQPAFAAQLFRQFMPQGTPMPQQQSPTPKPREML